MNKTRQPPRLLHLLGLTPLLAATATPGGALLLGIATLVATLLINAVVALLRPYIAEWQRWPLYALLIACAGGSAELLAQAYAFAWRQDVALYLPLLASNCLLFAGADASARTHLPGALRTAAASGAAMAVTLFAAALLRREFPGDSLGVSALLGAGLLLAAVRYWRGDGTTVPSLDTPPAPAATRRVRVTGPVR